MRYIDEFRNPALMQRYAERIASATTRSWTIMEICGGQTHSIVRHGIDRLLPDAITLLHGPGCPVCVTPAHVIDAAIALATKANVVFCSFGDMLRVPGTGGSLLTAKAQGADVRVVYSPLDALAIARETDREVVFFSIGFETTAPASAIAVLRAAQDGIKNFSLLVSHVLVPPAIEAILRDPENRVEGFLAAGHVCTVMGYEEYEPVAKRHGVPIVVTGFEPVDLLQGILLCIQMLEEGVADVENAYARMVRRTGNSVARDTLRRVFEVKSQSWRGMGEIAGSGLGLSSAYRDFDAWERFGLATCTASETGPCISGEVLRGRRNPRDCPAFGTACTPEHPLGATMVSSEGACAAYHRYRYENDVRRSRATS